MPKVSMRVTSYIKHVFQNTIHDSQKPSMYMQIKADLLLMGDNLPRSSSIEGSTSISSPLPGLFSATIAEDLSPTEKNICTCNNRPNPNFFNIKVK